MLQQVSDMQEETQIFHWPYCYSYFWHRFNRIVKRAGLPTGRRGKWHKVRRTVATFYEAAGGKATVLLGRSSRKVTEAYPDTRYIKTPQPCELIDPLP